MHQRVPGIELLAALLVLICVTCYSADKPLVDLEREVEKVLSDPDNVSRRKRIAPVFELASRYMKAGETNKALSFYAKALEHRPWHLDAQISVAELLQGKGETDQAREKALLVFNRAETDALLGRAAKVLRTAFELKLPESEPWPEKTNALALVPVGEIDVWLLLDLRRELQDALQMPVIIQRAAMTIPRPGRDALHLKAEDLREKINKAKYDPAFQTLLRRHKLSTQGLNDDDNVFVLTEKILETEPDKEQARRFREELGFLRRLGPQWDAAPLLDQMKQSFLPVRGSSRGILGITKLDLYSTQSRYVFGLAENGGNRGIVSYWRYRSDLADDPPNRERLRERTLKQALSSSGLLFGLPRCTDPTCARAYANDLTEHDSKEPRLCSACKEAFAKRFGK
jgi:predicted Zn-dependent protease